MPNIFAGLISATSCISASVSFAALIFAGDATRDLPSGVGMVLASSAIIGAIASLRSSFPAVIAGPQENIAVIVALIVGSVIRQIKPGFAALPTLVVAIGLTSFATGALFLLLGAFRLGKMVRFVPYPVVGGFLAGTGWLLVPGAIGVMLGISVNYAQIPTLFRPDTLVRWLPGIGLGLVLTMAVRRSRHFLLLPGMLFGSIALFYVVAGIAGISPSEAMNRGWLLGPFPGGGMWPPISASSLGQIDWSVLPSAVGNISACMVLAAISLLLNATSLELASERDIDLDRELRVTGVANMATGMLGGVPGYLAIGESMLNHKARAGRAAGLIAAAFCVAAIIIGPEAMAYFPKPVLGAMLFFLGLSFLLETVYDGWFRLPRGEYALVILILVVVVVVGFLEGVGVGIVVSSFLFAFNYARIDVVRHAISGARLRSKASRSVTEEGLLQKMGDHIHVVQLQGYIFFGTAYQLLQRIKKRLLSPQPLPVQFVVLDFHHVDGLDSSAVVTFSRMRELAAAQGASLVLTELPSSVRRQLVRGGCLDPAALADGGKQVPIHVFSDLDHGLEWCETQLLASNPESQSGSGVLERELGAVMNDREMVARLLTYLKRVEAPAGFDIYKKDEVSNDLYLIESGELEAWIDLANGRSMRLRTMGAGAVVGESGLYLGARRSASVRTTKPSVLHQLTIPALERMTREAPELAAFFHRFVARLLADRMVHTTSAAQMLFY